MLADNLGTEGGGQQELADEIGDSALQPFVTRYFTRLPCRQRLVPCRRQLNVLGYALDKFRERILHLGDPAFQTKNRFCESSQRLIQPRLVRWSLPQVSVAHGSPAKRSSPNGPV